MSNVAKLMECDVDGLKESASVLRAGGLVAFPTETVYGRLMITFVYAYILLFIYVSCSYVHMSINFEVHLYMYTYM
jgi:hypothetical protein